MARKKPPPISEHRKRRPGPKPQRRNPSPRPDAEVDFEGQWVELPYAEWSPRVAVEVVDGAERALRRDFKARRRELSRQSHETVETAAWRIARLIREVAEDNWLEHLWWTGRRREDIEGVPVDRLYPLTREPGGTWTLRYVGPGSEAGGPRDGFRAWYGHPDTSRGYRGRES